MRKLSLLALAFTLFGVGVTGGRALAVEPNEFPPELTILKEVDRTQANPKDVITYRITVVNIGAGQSDNTIVTDFVPANTTYVPNSTRVDGVLRSDLMGGVSPLSGGLNVGTLEPFPFTARARVITFQVTVNAAVPAGTVIRNFAQVRSDDHGTVTSNEVLTTVRAAVCLIITKAADRSTAAPRGVISYTIAVMNAGNIPATNVIVTDPNPAPTIVNYVPGSTTVNGTPVPDAPGGGSPVAAGLNVGTIGAGATTTVRLQRVVVDCAAVGSIISNTASVRSDQTPSQNSNTVTVTVSGAVILALTKSADPTSVAPTDTVTYTLRIQNFGNIDSTNTIVTDAVFTPAGLLTYVAGTTTVNGVAVPDASDGSTPLVAGLNIGTVAACGTATVTFRMRLTGCPTPGTTITNTATVRSDQAAAVTSNTVTVTTLPDRIPPTIEFISPAEGAVFTRCQTLTGSVRITDECPGVDPASIVIRIGGTVVPFTVTSTPGGVIVNFSFNLEFVPIGPLTITVEARDLAGNLATATRTVTIDCSFDCALELIVRASAAGAFRCAGKDEVLFLLVSRARTLAGPSQSAANRELCRRILEEVLECLTMPSRELRQNAAGLRTPAGGFANFNRDAASEARRRVLEEEIRCLIATKC